MISHQLGVHIFLLNQQNFIKLILMYFFKNKQKNNNKTKQNLWKLALCFREVGTYLLESTYFMVKQKIMVYFFNGTRQQFLII